MFPCQFASTLGPTARGVAPACGAGAAGGACAPLSAWCAGACTEDGALGPAAGGDGGGEVGAADSAGGASSRGGAEGPGMVTGSAERDSGGGRLRSIVVRGKGLRCAGGARCRSGGCGAGWATAGFGGCVSAAGFGDCSSTAGVGGAGSTAGFGDSGSAVGAVGTSAADCATGADAIRPGSGAINATWTGSSVCIVGVAEPSVNSTASARRCKASVPHAAVSLVKFIGAIIRSGAPGAARGRPAFVAWRPVGVPG